MSEQTKVTLNINGKERIGILYTEQNVMFYEDGVYGFAWIAEESYYGTPKELVKSNMYKAFRWKEVPTGNPYGSYESQCEKHALGLINMDDTKFY